MSPITYLALGTNLVDRQANLTNAIHRLSPKVRLETVSSVYETEPWGFLDQPNFLNLVLRASTDLSPTELLAYLKSIEAAMGREKTIRNGPRVIDLDILLYDDKVIESENLTIPHKSMVDRSFVLVPLSEIAPDLLHPVTKQTIAEHLSRIGSDGVRKMQDSADLMSVLCGKLPFFGHKTYIMGILNITPDSFSGDGLLGSADPVEAAVEQARKFIADGALILDIGAESTRPGSQVVDEHTEIDRILPVVRAIKAEKLNAWLSIDTYKSSVAEMCLKAGADWINDVWGLRADKKMAAVAAEYDAPVVLMHNRSDSRKVAASGNLGGTYLGAKYENLIDDVKKELLQSVALAHSAGIKDERIILDPGIGFGKTVAQNLSLINHLDMIKDLGFPVLLGPSRKSFIGYAINEPVSSRLEGTIAACVVGILRGADILRVHDVAEVSRAARLIDAMLRAG